MADLHIVREYDSAIETVFAFLTQTRHLLKWWGYADQIVAHHQLDLTKPGPWFSDHQHGDGTRSHKLSGEVTAVEPPKRIAFSWAFHDENDARGHNSYVEYRLTPVTPNRTKFELIHTGLPDEPAAQRHEKGWTGILARLEEKLGDADG